MHLGQIIFKCGYKTIFYYYLFQEKSTRWYGGCGKIVLDMDMFPKPLGEDSLCPLYTSKDR